MRVEYERCCGLDVHKETVVACVITPGTKGKPVKENRTYRTMTSELQALAAWLQTTGCTHVAMESTGVYWKPIYNVREGRFDILVVHAEHIKKVAGRKTDVADAEWIADLLRHGLLRGSFIPSAQQRAWRDLTRYRTRLVDERTSEVNRLHKLLEDANSKLASVATDIMGVSGRMILRQLIEHLTHIDYLDEAIGRLDAEIAEQMRPFEEILARWDQLPGVSTRIAQIIVAEVGTDLKQFEDAAHPASWAGLCPGNHESAGKRKRGKVRKGSRWLRRALTEAAHGAARTKNKYYNALYHRLVGRRGKKRAVVAVAHSLLVTGYYLITRQRDYVDLGPNYFDERNRQAVRRRAVRRLEQLGFQVSLTPSAESAA